jgi:uncharacterized protein (DUF2267 family)
VQKGEKMEELIKQISQKTGISEDQARQAITMVADFLKQRLPAPIAQQIDGLLSGGGMPDLSKGIGGIFGGNK